MKTGGDRRIYSRGINSSGEREKHPATQQQRTLEGRQAANLLTRVSGYRSFGLPTNVWTNRPAWPPSG